MSEGSQASVEKMRRAGVPDAAIATFSHYYEQLEAGESGHGAGGHDRAGRATLPTPTRCPRATRRSTRRS